MLWKFKTYRCVEEQASSTLLVGEGPTQQPASADVDSRKNRLNRPAVVLVDY